VILILSFFVLEWIVGIDNLSYHLWRRLFFFILFFSLIVLLLLLLLVVLLPSIVTLPVLLILSTRHICEGIPREVHLDVVGHVVVHHMTQVAEYVVQIHVHSSWHLEVLASTLTEVKLETVGNWRWWRIVLRCVRWLLVRIYIKGWKRRMGYVTVLVRSLVVLGLIFTGIWLVCVVYTSVRVILFIWIVALLLVLLMSPIVMSISLISLRLRILSNLVAIRKLVVMSLVVYLSCHSHITEAVIMPLHTKLSN
jgi:hypothetical protein